jgi:hypothetical protein
MIPIIHSATDRKWLMCEMPISSSSRKRDADLS